MKAVDTARIERAAQEILEAIGCAGTLGTADTPRRYAKWWAEFMGWEKGSVDTAFSLVEADQLVVVSGINVWSICEHHLLPFSARIAIGYIASDRILGLSKFGRIAKAAARRPQVQEALVRDIADEVQRVTGSPDIAVTASGVHLCMAMRGVEMPAVMTSSVLRGVFRNEPETRAEFMRLSQGASGVGL